MFSYLAYSQTMFTVDLFFMIDVTGIIIGVVIGALVVLVIVAVVVFIKMRREPKSETYNA